ncbi:MAG: hypothetical protein HZA34_03870 [Candidatus Pacebacteria bacterium]|nr:hypothetical protein [Candidatus Paceibacterota bacterium]
MVVTIFFTIGMKIFGMCFGALLPLADILMHALYLHPQDADSQGLIQAVKEKKFGTIIHEIFRLADEPHHYIHRGILFFGVYVLTSLFVLTSTGSVLGKGFIAGFGASLLWAMYPYRNHAFEFRTRFFWGVSTDVSHAFFVVCVIALCILTVLTIVV